VAAGFGRGDFDVEEPFQERGVSELGLGCVVKLTRERFGGRGEARVGEMGAQFLVGRVLAHRLTSTSSA